MSVETNRQTALKYFELCKERNLPFPEEFVTEDCKFWVPGMGTFDKTQFKALTAQAGKVMAILPRMEIVGITCEGDRVAMEAQGHGELANGKRYDNTYHFLFVFREGRICLVKEYNDTKYATQQLGM